MPNLDLRAMPPLFPCPFCGNPPIVVAQHDEVDRSDGQGVVIECVGTPLCPILVKASGNRFEAAKKWNTRTISPETLANMIAAAVPSHSL